MTLYRHLEEENWVRDNHQYGPGSGQDSASMALFDQCWRSLRMKALRGESGGGGGRDLRRGRGCSVGVIRGRMVGHMHAWWGGVELGRRRGYC